MPDLPIAVIDSCVFVCVLTGGKNDEPDACDHCVTLLNGARPGPDQTFEAHISALTLAEVCGTSSIRGNHLPRNQRRDCVQTARRWLETVDYRMIDADEYVCRKAAHIAPDYQLKGADAVILATALAVDAAKLFTLDGDLLKLDGKIEGLEIKHPKDPWPAQGTLNI